MKRIAAAALLMITLVSCSMDPDPTGDRQGEWRTVVSPSGVEYECYVVAGYRSVAMECFAP